jgi:hypothetical protein
LRFCDFSARFVYKTLKKFLLLSGGQRGGEIGLLTHMRGAQGVDDVDKKYARGISQALFTAP